MPRSTGPESFCSSGVMQDRILLYWPPCIADLHSLEGSGLSTLVDLGYKLSPVFLTACRARWPAGWAAPPSARALRCHRPSWRCLPHRSAPRGHLRHCPDSPRCARPRCARHAPARLRERWHPRARRLRCRGPLPWSSCRSCPVHEQCMRQCDGRVQSVQHLRNRQQRVAPGPHHICNPSCPCSAAAPALPSPRTQPCYPRLAAYPLAYGARSLPPET